MIEAYVLAAELARADGDYARAFARYHERLGPLLRSKQDAARGLGVAFAPGPGRRGSCGTRRRG